MIIKLIETVYAFLWGDLFTIPVMGSSVGISLMLLLLIPAGVYFTIRTRLLPVRLFSDMMKALKEKKETPDSLSSLQTLIISTATRVGMGNLVGVVAAVSLGGAGAFSGCGSQPFWVLPPPLWRLFWHRNIRNQTRSTAAITAAPLTIFTILWKSKQDEPSNVPCLPPACHLRPHLLVGISQVISNSVSSAFANAFQIPPITTTVILVIISAVIVLRKNATVKVLDIVVPVMAVGFFLLTLFIILMNLPKLPAVFGRIFTEAFGLRQAVSGGFGAVLLNGVKRGPVFQ